MSHEHLVKWGKDAFDKGFSLEHIENYLLRRGFRRKDALKALHEITSFEHRVHDEEGTSKALAAVSALILLAISGIAVLYFLGIMRIK